MTEAGAGPDVDIIIDFDGEVRLVRGFLDAAQADALFDQLFNELDWQEESIKIYGRDIKVPRLVCWYGEPGAVYTYSGVTHRPLPWHDGLFEVKQRIETFSGALFNSVLANLYRDGQDSMGWHADKEKELGDQPFIASLSLGASRLFRLQHNKSREIHDIVLDNGSLLLMGGELQRKWRHSVPKQREESGARINLTFRVIMTDA